MTIGTPHGHYWLDGVIYQADDGLFFGIADDGIHVFLGDSWESVEVYLLVHPTPADWR